MVTDLAALAGAVAPVANGNIIFVAGPTAFAKMKLRLKPLPFSTFSSSALDNNMVMAVAPGGFVSAIDPIVDFDTSTEAVIHEDTDPTDIGTTGTRNTVAAPTGSLFQTDTVATRVILQVAWGIRAPANQVAAVVAPISW